MTPPPNLTVHAEPAEGSGTARKLVYASCAAKSSSDPANGQLLLSLDITNNNGTLSIELQKVAISFVGPPSVGPFEIPVRTPDPGGTLIDGLTIPPGEVRQWTLLDSWNEDIVLPVPAPGTVEISLHCDDPSAHVVFDPWVVTMPLAQYTSPVAGGGYAFPHGTSDLEPGEFWIGRSSSDYHRARGYDLVVDAWDSSAGKWNGLIPGADGTKKEHFRPWGKNVYAIADGDVVHSHDGVVDNPPNAPNTGPGVPGGGNHLFVQHGADRVLYAHFRQGTLTANGIKHGTKVVKGQLLGQIGNSGNTYNPHLHISIDNPLRPLPFSDIHVLDRDSVDTTAWPPNDLSPWNRVTAQCLPAEKTMSSGFAAIWPGTLQKQKGSGVCASQALLALGHSVTGLALLREVRDTRIAASRSGRRLIESYYRHSGEVSALLRADPRLAARAAAIVEEIARALEAGPRLSGNLRARSEILAREIVARGSPGLRHSIAVALDSKEWQALTD